jgi:ribosomal protein L11 methyltransferase
MHHDGVARRGGARRFRSLRTGTPRGDSNLSGDVAKPGMAYLLRTYLMPADLEDVVMGELWAAGTLGVQFESRADGRVRLEAYFLPGAFSSVQLPPGVECVGQEEIPDTDWLAGWREGARPGGVGRSFLVDPREPEEGGVEVPAGRRLLRLPARGAFGTGSHESTSLAVELLEEVEVRGKRVLDVGTGTGILAFAALARGATEAVAFDVDPTAPFHARDNAVLNGLQPRLFAGTVAALREEPRFDVALVNMVPEEFLSELPAIVDRLAPDGEAILSGILRERGAEMLKSARALGLVQRGRREEGEWVAFRLGLPAGHAESRRERVGAQ